MKERLTAASYRLGWALVRWVPERLAAYVFRRIADEMWRRRGRGVRRLEANLRRVVGVGVGEVELRALSRAGMRSYLRYWLEVFRLPVMSRERIRSNMRITGIDELFATLDRGRGVIVPLPHMGNWDHAGAWLCLAGVRFTTVAERLKPESLYDRFVAFREALGFEVVPLTGGMAGPYEVLTERLTSTDEGGRGRVVCLLADRRLTSNGATVTFFGEPARMAAGPAALAIDTGAALMPATLWYEGKYWCVRVYPEIPVPPDGDRRHKVAAMTQAMADAFAEGIAEHPEDWHMLQRVWDADAKPRGAG